MINQKRSLSDLITAFETKTTTSSGDDSWKKFFPFYKGAVDTTTTVRFLPDLNEDNPRGFLVENHYHELTINGRKERVACLRQHGEQCPACDASAKFYDKTSPVYNEAKGKQLYRKKSYIAQCVVLESPVQSHTDAKLVQLLDFGPQIYNKMIADMKSGDLENNPVEFKGGHNFRIRKSLNGTENSYATSSFSPKATDLPDDMIDQIVDQLYDLSEHCAKKIDASVMETMVQAAINSTSVPVATQQRQVPQESVASQLAAATATIGIDNPEVGAETYVATAAPAVVQTAQVAAPAASGTQSARDVIRARAAALREARGE